MRWPWQDPALQRYFAVFIVCTLAFLVGLWFKRKEERERREKPRPLEVKETYERHAVLQLKTIQDGMDKLLQSHAALEQKMDTSIQAIAQTYTMLELRLSGLDAPLKGTGDTISLLLEERFATLDQQIAYILHDLLADLRKAKEPARRKKAKK